MNFFVLWRNGPQGVEGVVGRAVQTEDGDAVDGLGQDLMGAAGGDDDLGALSTKTWAWATRLGKSMISTSMMK